MIYAVLIVLPLAVAERGRAEERVRPYQGDPEIVVQIRDLPDNTSIVLPPFKLAGDGVEQWREKYGRAPQRRDYCNKIVYAPDRGTGMYCGMNHGAPHRLNDAWEYHLGSNTWHLLFAPDTNYSAKEHRAPEWIKSHVVFEDGYLQTRRGGMLNSVHTWDALTYDPVLKRMLWANVASEHPNEWKVFAETRGLDHDELLKQKEPGSRLWMYDPQQGRWFKQMGPGPHPQLTCQGGTLAYIPDLQKSLWYACQWNESGMWAYDSKANTWQELKPNGVKSMYHDKSDTFPRPELQAAYSPIHQKLVAVRGTGTWWYDIKSNEWSKACDDAANDAHDARSVFAYDSINDIFLLHQPHEKTLRGYRIETNQWETLEPRGAGVSTGGAGYFDPTLNALVVYERDRMWAYRYRQ
jgi:hypothetical protein